MSAGSPTGRTRSNARRARIGMALTGLLFVLAGCAAPGKVKDYNATVEANFIDRCVAANDAKDPEPISRDRCTCWYGKLKEKYSFDQFKKLDTDLRAAVNDGSVKTADDLKSKFGDYYDVVTSSDCSKAGPSAPTTTAGS